MGNKSMLLTRVRTVSLKPVSSAGTLTRSQIYVLQGRNTILMTPAGHMDTKRPVGQERVVQTHMHKYTSGP